MGYLRREDLVFKSRRELSGIALHFGVDAGEYDWEYDKKTEIIDRILDVVPTFKPGMTREEAADLLVDMTQGGAFLTHEQAIEFINGVRAITEEVEDL